MGIQFYKDVSEKTNRGKLSKAWYKIDGHSVMVKGNTKGTLGSLGKVGYEPYSEVMASNIASTLGLPHVHYELMDARLFPEIGVYGIKHVSVCRNYLPEGYKAYPLRRYLILNNVETRKDALSFLQRDTGLDLSSLYLILLFDALIGNEDRHLNNIDIVQDPSGKVSFAPIFDNGASLLAWRYPFEFPSAGLPYILDKARPFAKTHKAQVELIPKGLIPKTELEPLLVKILKSIEPIGSLLPPRRYKAIIKYLTWRVRYLGEVMT